MLSNMATSLILHNRITTTVAKAKALRSYVELLFTKSKDDITHSRNIDFSFLKTIFHLKHQHIIVVQIGKQIVAFATKQCNRQGDFNIISGHI